MTLYSVEIARSDGEAFTARVYVGCGVCVQRVFKHHLGVTPAECRKRFGQLR